MTYIEIRNSIITKIKDALNIDPSDIGGIFDDIVNKMEENEISFTQAFYGSLATADSNPFTAGKKGFALASESGTYSNLPGTPTVDVATYPISFLVYDGTTTTVDGFTIDLTNYYTKTEIDNEFATKEDKGSFSEDVDAKNHKVTNLARDLENNSAAVDTASIIGILNNYVKTHNADLNFAGVKSASDGTPASKSDFNAWIMYSAGSWQGQTVEIGDIVYFEGGTFKKQTRYSIEDLRKYII